MAIFNVWYRQHEHLQWFGSGFMDFLSKMLCPAYFTMAFLSILYGVLFQYDFIKSGLTLREIRGEEENDKKYTKQQMPMQIQKEDFNAEILEKVELKPVDLESGSICHQK